MQPAEQATAQEFVDHLIQLAQQFGCVGLVVEDGQVKVGVLDIEPIAEDWLSEPVPIHELPVLVQDSGL